MILLGLQLQGYPGTWSWFWAGWLLNLYLELVVLILLGLQISLLAFYTLKMIFEFRKQILYLKVSNSQKQNTEFSHHPKSKKKIFA